MYISVDSAVGWILVGIAIFAFCLWLSRRIR